MDRIACIIVDDEPTARDILQLLIEKIGGVDIIACCKNALEAIAALNEHCIDLIFLDINMPDMSGIALAKSISTPTKVIFTTAYREYAVDGFDLQAVDYLLKPIPLERLVQAIQKYRAEHKPTNDEKKGAMDYLLVRSDRKTIKIDLTQLMFVESLNDYVKLHTVSKTIITRESISTIEAKLSSQLFVRIHRSFLVAIPYISSYTAEYVEIQDRNIAISRSYRNTFLSKIEGK